MRLGRTRTAAIGAVVLAVVAVLVPPTSGAQAAAVGCSGESATIIGDGAWTDRLIGTPGRDVIVSNGAQFVDARGGDDLVCITGTASVQNSIKVFDGPGDDVVRNDSMFTASGADQGNAPVYVYLLAGDDTFVGGTAPEFVAAYTGTDDISTGAGFDTVFAGSPPADPEGLGGPFSGRIDLGDEGGRLYAGPLLQSSTILIGDDAQSELALTDDVPRESGWVIDAAAGEARIDGQLRYAFTGFTRFSWSSHDVARFTGTDGPDVVSARGLGVADTGRGNDRVYVTSPGRVDLGPGNDRLDISGSPSGSSPGHVDAGDGTDLLVVRSEGLLELDLSEERLQIMSARWHADIPGFEGFAAQSHRIVALGTDRADHVDLVGCRVEASMARGDDTLRVGLPDPDDWRCSTQRFALQGGPGNDRVRAGGRNTRMTGGRGDDRLVGSRYADELIGNSGIDTAIGGGGRDRCVAETKRTCER